MRPPELEERTLQAKRGKTRGSAERMRSAKADAATAERTTNAQPRYLVTFDGLMEVPDSDDMIESLEREVEVIRSPILC